MISDCSYIADNNTNSEIVFLRTDDGSVGLFNKEIGDVYHSSFGALEEAREKFVKPLNFYKNFKQKIKNCETIKILDICSGISYNSKAFMDYIFKLPEFATPKINIDALEYDNRLILLSPFIKDGLSDASLSYFLLYNMQERYLESFEIIKNIILAPRNRAYLSAHIIDLLKKNQFNGYCKDPIMRFERFLHNIYYQYVSKRNKKALKPANLRKFLFNPHCGDARKFVKSALCSYDIVFLDAFTPLKLPTLWSEEFFAHLYNIMNSDSILVTYSNSVAIRHAMKKAGFFIGKNFDKNKRQCGTIASKNTNFIEHPLTEFDYGLMLTNAGITFNDPELDWSGEAILSHYKLKKSHSNLQSSSSYIKLHKKNEDSLCTIL